jgi:hypothetical protein
LTSTYFAPTALTFPTYCVSIVVKTAPIADTMKPSVTPVPTTVTHSRMENVINASNFLPAAPLAPIRLFVSLALIISS